MKLDKTIFLFAILLFLIPSAVIAEEIEVTDADSVWTSNLIATPPDANDSTDAPTENLIKWAFVSHADSVWDSELISPSPDALDSTDAPEKNLIKWAFVSHADSVWNTELEKVEIVPQKWSFALITDLHIGRGYPDYDGTSYETGGNGEDYYLTERLKKVVDWIKENKNNIDCGEEKCPIKFLAVLGDFGDSSEKSEFIKAKNILDKLNEYDIPYVPVFGNHDVWPYTDDKEAISTFGEIYFDEIFWNENATNTKLLKERFDFQRDETNPKYKNFSFSYKQMNFIGLDFVERKPTPFGSGVSADAELFEETKNWLINRVNESQGSTILLSHHPFVNDSITAFESNEIEQIKEIIKDGNVLANFGGHIHGAYPFLLPHLTEYFMDANWEYPSLSTTPVLTTEALMVAGNEKDITNKGIIRIVKVNENNEIDCSTTEGKFPALNPYISFDFKILPEQIYACVFFKAHLFSHRDYSLTWDLGDGNTGTGIIETHCYKETGIYNVKLTGIDKETGREEYITRKLEVKEGIIPKLIKIADEVKDKLELISTELGEKVTEFGRTMKDTILIKVKHSSSTPAALINIHFEKANEDIDLTPMIVDTNPETKKSVLYMPEWPSEIEKSKILFIPK